MHSLSQRANAVLALAITVACAVAAISAAIGPLLSTVSPIELATPKINRERGHLGGYYNHHSAIVELGVVYFDLEAVTIWDDIITHRDDARITFRDKCAEDPLTYVENVVNGIKANLTLHWNTFPVQSLMLNDRMWIRLSTRYSTPVLASVQFGKKQ
ncbi:hypothetical protein BJ742DRAFT_743862 [Cladochytrium replicatum]|nr:hypothetical protein BJ742DRAFT_743862 [Cladochytrium replicatum]